MSDFTLTGLKIAGYLAALKQRDSYSSYCITRKNFIVVENQSSNFSFKAITCASKTCPQIAEVIPEW